MSQLGSMGFDDEFDGTALNSKYWVSDPNGHTMNDVNTDPANVSVGNGYLNLTLSSQSDGATITTNPGSHGPGFQMGYGYVEFAAIFPGSGSTIDDWAAVWTSGLQWPQDGEADIAESSGCVITSNYHYGNPTDNPFNGPNLDGSWGGTEHTYGLLRLPGKNEIYYDGQLVETYPTGDGGALESLIVTIGDNPYGCTVVPAQIKVDYVREWNLAA